MNCGNSRKGRMALWAGMGPINMRKKVAVTFLVLFMVGVCLGAAREWLSERTVVPPSEQVHEPSPTETSPKSAPPPSGTIDTNTVTVYFSDGEAMYLRPEQRIADDSKVDRVEMVIGELIRGPQTENLVKTVPPNARLRQVWVDGGVAYVDFSREFQTEHWGGSTGDTFTLFSVVNSLTELPGINAVQFLVEGEVEEAILGHTDTTEPISRREDLINRDPDY
ncbi:MAG: GerMN domain-containing protein [Firmicutes bacterium]|nr:GerMN domain-containing protein [Bacillota bacterium]